MTDTNTKRTDRVAADQAMIDGVEKFLASIATLPVGGKNMTPTDIVKVFQDRINAGKAAQAAETARTAAVKADKDERATTAAFVRAFRRIVIGMFQEDPNTLAIFGLKAPKARKVGVAKKAAAVAKNKATREARGTRGKKAKLAIKGTVPADNGGAEPAPPTPAAAAPETPAKPNA